MSLPPLDSTSSSERQGIEFTYRPLDLAQDSLRLIRVYPDRSRDGCLQLDLWHSVISAKYHCVSYQWGSDVRQHKICIKGCRFAVGENLHAFLQEVYTWAIHGFDEPIWIDAVCIDQSCNLERGHQVHLMGSIYSNAREVFVWLGDHGELADAFSEWLSVAHVKECPSHLHDQWNKIRFNTYWQRAWIKQEILLAQRVTVVLRGAKIEWTVLGGAIARSGSLTQLENEHAAHLWTFWGERWLSKHGQNCTATSIGEDLFSFWSLMHTHRTADCTDRRDRVYSLLGLVNEKHNFKVDYDESTADLFWRVSAQFEVGDSPELVDILSVALLDSESERSQQGSAVINPWGLVQSLLRNPYLNVRLPVRRVTPMNSFARRVRRGVKCKSNNCKQAPRLPYAHDDLLICTNERSEGFTEHGCIHAIAHPLDQPAAEPYEIRMVAHHRDQIATATLLSTAMQFWDVGTQKWIGITTWSSLQRALNLSGLVRMDRVKLSIPATYAMMIWFGVHPSQLDDARFVQDAGLPSAYHALPTGTKITKGSIELPPT
ncbi:hypothetical protein E8E12_006931 [Didymella heteroderae]|uniref:Heterokaryon incompatibility domain-containing protein n=1 Tax=Didymella heteroderae TaxID=1769908 RepID=A0A9P5BYV7_9PLEO|nr:hypothetical protein E8E12_006931 [Didymella heteroderae]